MEYSLLKDILTTKRLGAYLETTPWGNFFYPNFFEWKYTPSLTYETLVGAKGRSVMADVVAYNTSAPQKTREVISKLTGEIQPIRVKRKMDEKELRDYYQMRNDASTPQNAILDLVFNDIDFVVESVQARLEWLCFQALCQGYITLTTSNNNGIITESNIDFQLPAANKRVLEAGTATRTWDNGTSSNYTPITDMRDLVDAAKSDGKTFRYAVMSYDQYQQFIQADEVQDYATPFHSPKAAIDTNSVMRPPRDAVNAMLRALELPEIIVIDQSLRTEDQAHSRSNVDPWTKKYVVFIPDTNVGELMWSTSAEELNPPKQVIQSKKGNILVSKWSNVDPVAEYTKGEIYAFPSMPAINEIYRLDVHQNDATGLD